MTRSHAMLEARGLETSYGTSQVLFGVDLAIAAGEVVTLLGRNGMGKTTTVRSIMGLTQPQAGEVYFSGRRLTGLPTYRVAQAGLGLVPEGRQIFPNLTVRENLVATARPPPAGSSAATWTIERIFALFPRLAERAGSMGGQLSGGEQQMLAIGRGLMAEPKLMIMDEPSLGLSPILVEELFALIERINADGVSILLVEQNVVQSLELADRAYILAEGKFVMSGSAKDIGANPELKRAYLGM